MIHLLGGGGDTPFVKPNVSYCVQENEVHYNPRTWADEYLTVRILEDGNLGFQFVNGLSLDYSFNGGITWDGTLTNDNNTILVTNGQEISFKKGNITSNDNSASDRLKMSMPTNYGNFFTNCQFEVFGNVMSIIDSENFANANVIHEDLGNLFEDCTKLVNAENLILPATTLASGCYSGMFYRCTSLTSAPELPVTTLANYCYSGMFFGCTSLTSAPELPVTTLAEGCYKSMFYGCTSLTSAPELPATILANDCYNYMFYGCTNLVNAPELPATTLASSCYNNMFYGCSSLNYIKAMFTTTPEIDYTDDWVSGVASSGTFVKNSKATWNVTGVDGVPTGWTVQYVTV